MYKQKAWENFTGVFICPEITDRGGQKGELVSRNSFGAPEHLEVLTAQCLEIKIMWSFKNVQYEITLWKNNFIVRKK